MALTSLDHYQTSITTKNDGKSKLSSIIEKEVEAINTLSNGKAMTLPKQCGNLPRVSKEAVKKLSEHTATTKTLTLDLISMAFEIPTLVLTDLEGQQSIPVIYESIPKKKEIF